MCSFANRLLIIIDANLRNDSYICKSSFHVNCNAYIRTDKISLLNAQNREEDFKGIDP